MSNGRIKAKVTVNKLAFWESLIDCGGEPTRYLKFGETVHILGGATIYDSFMGDKEYVKVSHNIYGVGYMRKEGLETATTRAN